ncbi:hypothetical protein J4410_07385 [Candidatus Woesearchaeota archaeon]|nr:hypothetical protein [Candidatus Woesearchaeota archaeon]
MLQKILSFFRRKPEVPTLTLGEHEVVQWLDQKHEALLPQVQEQLKIVNNKVLQSAEETRKELMKLMEAELQNPHIADREKHFMIGNRETYVKRTYHFLQNLQLLETPGKSGEYFANYALNLSQFHETTQRPYHIVSQFFKNEIGSVAEKIRQIDDHVKEIREIITKAKYQEWTKLKQQARTFQELVQRFHELQEEEKKLHEIEVQLQIDLQEKERLLEEFRKTQEYERVLALKEHLQVLIEKDKQKKLEIQELFSSLEQGLKKYARISFQDEKMILSYLEDSLRTLQDDKHFRICMVVQNMKLALQKDQILMKPDKKEKTIQDCDRVTKEYLSQILKTLLEFKKQEHDLLTQVKEIPVMQDIAALKKQKEDLVQEQQTLQQRLQRVIKERENLGLEKQREELATHLSTWLVSPLVIISS